jgi:hypothetical protein
MNKVQFALGFFTEGLPAEWAFLFIKKVAKKDKDKNLMPWGTWNKFYDELEVVFGDLNKKRNELMKLENLMMKTGQTATEFFKEFDLYALCADYMKNNQILIRMAEKKIPRQLVCSLFNHGTPLPVSDMETSYILSMLIISKGNFATPLVITQLPQHHLVKTLHQHVTRLI